MNNKYILFLFITWMLFASPLYVYSLPTFQQNQHQDISDNEFTKQHITLPNIELFHPSVIKYAVNNLPFMRNRPIFSMNGESEYDHHVDKIFRTVHPPGLYINIADAWLGSGNAASFAGFAPPNKLQIPIRMNIVFIGFLNEKNDGIPKNQLRSWFDHLQDKITHTVVEHPKDFARPKNIGEETDVLEYIYKFHTFDLSSAVANAIKEVVRLKSIYDEKDNTMVLQVSELEAMLESLLSIMSRKSSLAHTYTFFVLNLQGLKFDIQQQQLKKENIANTKKMKHGYRDGFSVEYIKTMGSSPTLKKLILDVQKKSNDALEFDDFMEDSVFPAGAAPKPERNHFEPHSVKNGAIDVKDLTEQWAKTLLENMKNKEGIIKPLNDTPENIARKILTANGKNSAMQRQKLLDAIAWSRSKDEMIRSGEDDSIKSSNAIDQSSCIVDAGISKSRFGWIDLSAGPFAYGPTIGGSGVRTKFTFPRVPDFPPLYINKVGEHRQHRRRLLANNINSMQKDQHGNVDKTKDDLDFLHNLDASKLINQLDEMEHTLLVLNQLLKAACAKTEDGLTSLNEVDCYRYTMKMKESVRNRDIYVNAVDILSGKKHAADGKQLSVNDMKRAYVDAKAAWEKFQNNNAGGIGHRNGKGNTDKYKIGPVDPMEMREMQVEHLLSHLSSTVESFMRHIVTPVSGRPVPTLSNIGSLKNTNAVVGVNKSPFARYYAHGHHENDIDGSKYNEILNHMHLKASKTPEYSSDLGTFIMPPLPADRVYHSERVTFHVHVVSNHKMFEPISIKNANPVDSFDFHEYRRQIMMLKSEDQEFSFTFQKISLDDDPTLASSLQLATSTTQVPTLSVSGHYKSERRKSIDTVLLYNRIRSLEKSDEFLHHKNMNEYKRKSQEKNKIDPKHNDFAHGEIPSREINVFLFSIHSSLPVMLDKYFLARSLPDTIFIVQSSKRFWKGPLSCNKKPIYLNLRNPLKDALLATQTTVSGTMPTYVSHHGTNAKPSHDWSWTVGNSPGSCFSTSRSHFSDFDVDTNYRAEIIQSLLAARQMVAEGIHKLHLQRTTWGNMLILRRFGYSFGWRVTRLRFLHFKIMENTNRILKMLEELRYQETFPLLNKVLHQSRTFGHLVERVVDVFHPYVCKPKKEESFSNLIWSYGKHILLFFAICVITFILGFICMRNLNTRASRNKPKIN